MQGRSWLDKTLLLLLDLTNSNIELTSKHDLLKNNSGWESINSDKNRLDGHIEHLHNQTNIIFKNLMRIPQIYMSHMHTEGRIII